MNRGNRYPSQVKLEDGSFIEIIEMGKFESNGEYISSEDICSSFHVPKNGVLKVAGDLSIKSGEIIEETDRLKNVQEYEVEGVMHNEGFSFIRIKQKPYMSDSIELDDNELTGLLSIKEDD